MSKFFLLQPDELDFCLRESSQEALAMGERPRFLQFRRLQLPSEGPDRLFLVAASIVRGAERDLRRRVKRKLAPGTRNISNRMESAAVCLGWAWEPEAMKTAKGKDKKRMLKEFQKLVDEAVGQLRVEKGWPPISPTEVAYLVTEDVLAAAADAGCEEYFAPLIGQRFFRADVLKMADDLQARYPGSEGVIDLLWATGNTDHLSMISYPAIEPEGIFLTIVSPEGHHLKVSADRFLDLLEHPDTTRRLHVFPPKGSREPVPFAYGENKQGEIVAQFIPREVKLDVACCQGQGALKNVVDRTWFYLPQNYLLCLGAVMQRLRDDRVRFETVKAQAEASVEFDPFSTTASNF